MVVQISVADDELDAARFEGGLREAREALASGSIDSSRSRLEAILALWSGPALSLARALRAAGDESAALVAALEAHRLATAKQDKAALRKIDAFLARDG